MKNADKPAAPFQEVTGMVGGVPTGYKNHIGITKREMFAMHALHNVLDQFNPYEYGQFDSSDYEKTAKACVGLADALLAELEKKDV